MVNGEKEEGDTGGWEECRKKCVQREGGMRWAGTWTGTWLQGARDGGCWCRAHYGTWHSL